MGIYLRDVVPFKAMINGDREDNVFLFGDKKPWLTGSLTDVLKTITQRGLGVSLTNRDFRQVMVAIDRRHIRPGEVPDDEDDDDEDDDPSDAHDIMAAHSVRTANNWDGQIKKSTQRVTPESMDMSRTVCSKAHKWLGMVSRVAGPDEDVSEEQDGRTAEQKIEEIVAEKYGSGFEWRCPEQKELAIKIVEGVSPLFCVIPTSGGKTEAVKIAAMLPEAKTTVFVTPLRALGTRRMQGKRSRRNTLRQT